MYTNSYKFLSETIKNAFAPIAKSYNADTIKDSFDELVSKMKELYTIMMPAYSSEHFKELALQLSDLCKNTLLILENSETPEDSLAFLDSIDIQKEYVELSEEDCNSINILLDLTNVDEAPKATPADKTPTVQFFLTIIIPIIIGFLQLWQNENHYKMDSIEAQNTQIQEQERYEQLMQSLSDIIDSLNELQESQESCPCNHSDAPVLQDEVPTDTPDAQLPDDSAE